MATFPVLVADIGGTHARFAWAENSNRPPGYLSTVKALEFKTPLAAAEHYLKLLSQTLGAKYVAPREAVFAVAATVGGDVISFTNSSWTFSCDEMQHDLKVSRFLALNDFEALAYALPYLGDGQVRRWGGVANPSRSHMAVLGPGTGLGVAGLLRTPSGWQALPGEGGHATLAPGNDFESELLALLRKSFEHVSAERLLSGVGLPLLHRSMLQVKGLVGEEYTTEELIKAGLAGEGQASGTLHLFCALLGSFAGNVALSFGARGGIFIGGGIVPRLGDFFFDSKFRERFDAKGRFSSYMKEIPVSLIHDTEAATMGAMYALAQWI
jgi:glucokinase